MKKCCISEICTRLFAQEDWEELNEYSINVIKYFQFEFSKHSIRFPDAHKLIAKFEESIKQIKAGGRSLFHLAHETHNELCVALALLENSNPSFRLLEYEPVLSGTPKSIDFRALSGAYSYYVDVKTIRPKLNNKWIQYEKLTKFISKNNSLFLVREWLGGEIWHSFFSSRGKMLSYSKELEEKVLSGNLSNGSNRIVMVFCGDDYHWHEDSLEDFISFYRSGRHRKDDPFGEMEAHEVKSKKISFYRNITNFCFLRRRQLEIATEGINWDVGSYSHAEEINY